MCSIYFIFLTMLIQGVQQVRVFYKGADSAEWGNSSWPYASPKDVPDWKKSDIAVNTGDIIPNMNLCSDPFLQGPMAKIRDNVTLGIMQMNQSWQTIWEISGKMFRV